jgi:hypothetical protein
MRPGTLLRAADAPALKFVFDGDEDAVYADLRGGTLRLTRDAPAGLRDAYSPLAPLLNAVQTQVLVPADNKALLLAAKLRLFRPSMIKVAADGDDDGDVYYVTETGIVQLGADMTVALLPVSAADFGLGQVVTLLPALTTVGLANDALGFRHLRKHLNGAAASLPMDAGKRTQIEINGALLRAAQKLI